MRRRYRRRYKRLAGGITYCRMEIFLGFRLSKEWRRGFRPIPSFERAGGVAQVRRSGARGEAGSFGEWISIWFHRLQASPTLGSGEFVGAGEAGCSRNLGSAQGTLTAKLVCSVKA